MMLQPTEPYWPGQKFSLSEDEKNMRGEPIKTQNYLLDTWAPCSTGFPGVFEEPTCVSAPAGVVVRGMFGFSEFFLKTLSAFAHFIMGDL